jgi:hypothetical protein
MRMQECNKKRNKGAMRACALMIVVLEIFLLPTTARILGERLISCRNDEESISTHATYMQPGNLPGAGGVSY